MVRLLCLFFLGITVSLNAVQEPNASLYSHFLMSEGVFTKHQMAEFLLSKNSELTLEFVDELCTTYIREAALEGVNHDIAFVQMLLETGFLKFGGQVSRDQNNFSGLGALDGGNPGLSFSTLQEGIRAHIQHLKAYGSQVPLNLELINPRFKYVRRGIAPTFHELAGRWASDRQYGQKLSLLLVRLNEFTRVK